MVRMDGTIAGPVLCRSRSSLITVAGSSPEAKRRSASRRSRGHEYEPGLSSATPARAIWTRCAASAARRRAVSTPQARQAAASRWAKSRPPRRRRYASLLCVSHNQTWHPCVRCLRERVPLPEYPQSAQDGPDASSAQPSGALTTMGAAAWSEARGDRGGDALGQSRRDRDRCPSPQHGCGVESSCVAPPWCPMVRQQPVTALHASVPIRSQLSVGSCND